MTNPDLTHIEFLLDRSGSMRSIADDIRGGFDTFMEKQRAEAGECTASLAQFDSRYEVMYTAVPLDEVEPLHLEPRGSTAMLDAIGRSVTALGTRLAELPEEERPGSVIVMIMTDGLENSSREYTYDTIRKMIRHQEDVYDWTFMYVGADQDAIEVGARMGISSDRAMTYDRSRSGATYGALAGSVSRLRSAIRAGSPAASARDHASFSEEEREAAGGDSADS